MVMNLQPPSKNWIPVLAGLPLVLSPFTVSCQTLETRSQPEARTQTTSVAAELPTRDDLPRAPNGRHYPMLPSQPREIAELIEVVETAAINPDISAETMGALAHQQQVIYRVLSRDTSLSGAVRNQLSPQWHEVFDHHIAARREFLAMHRGPASNQLPAWRIQAPAPAEELLKAYRSASTATGIDWEVLAAVNLVETGMGRIDGVSVANAQGPMQFLPTTWAEPGIGQGGDIRDP